MKILDKFRRATTSFKAAWHNEHQESFAGPHGEVFITMRDGATGAIQEERHIKNVVTKDASILIARLMKDNVEPSKGTFVLAVGSGDAGWILDPLNPPAPTENQRSLYGEITRKTFSLTQFIDAGGVPVAYPTKVIDLTCQYAESEAVGPLMEMGIIGGNISTNMAVRNPVTPPLGPYDPTVDLTLFETLCNYLTFGLITKAATSTLTITWRFSF
jgi:hypothetical protein